ncbi:MAG TPA: alpha/beta hydrolase-fold protein [Thermoanaerobaculia bacterium]|nr:alpha/beta hydrolase-fold protein [Thermoanaerobaculia bacterium]
MKSRLALIVLTVLLPLSVFADVRVLTLESSALAGNQFGDPTTQTFAVYVPPGYEASTARYPVVYLLHGIGDSFEVWTKAWKIPEMLDRLIAEKKIAPMIVVMPNSRSRFLGTYYEDSPVSGGWGSLVAVEIVGLVDRQFRTIATRESRGVTGHSMGGYGAIRFGMERPELFSAVYAMSPCCLDTVEDISWGNQQAWRTFLGFKTREDADAALQKGDFYPPAILSLLSAVSPDPKAPLGVEVPVRLDHGELTPIEPAFTNFRNQLPVRQVAQYRDNLRRLRALHIDYGFSDQFAHIPVASAALSRELIDHGVPHVLAVYDGDHRQRVVERMEKIVFPMFSEVLAK